MTALPASTRAEILAVVASIPSIVGLVDVSVQCAREINGLLQRLRDAPDDLLALANEVSDSTLVLLELERALKDIRNNTTFEDAHVTDLADSHLRRGNTLSSELKSLVTSVQTALPDGRAKLNIYQWLKYRSKTQKLKEELRNVQVGLHELLNSQVATGAQYQNVQTQLNNIERLGEQAISRLDEVTRCYGNLETASLRTQSDVMNLLSRAEKQHALSDHDANFKLAAAIDQCQKTNDKTRVVKGQDYSTLAPDNFSSKCGQDIDKEASSLIFRRDKLDEDNRIFQLIQSGDTTALKSGLDRRLVSLHDLRAETGELALTYALRIGHQKRGEMTKILLSAGTSLFQENDHGISAIYLVRKRISGNRGDALYRILLREYFPDRILHKGWELTDLHRFILGMLYAKLNILLEKWEIRTEAAARGDVEAIRELLLSGADINARDEEGTTLLSYAFLTVKSASAKVLIKAGVDVTARRIYGNEPLYYAGNRCQDDLSPIDSLIQGGADIDSKNEEYYTALLYAVNSDKTSVIAFLLDRGAQLEHRDVRGDIPILLAINKNSYKSINLLLDRGAKFNTVNKKGSSLLLIAAQDADLNTRTQLVLYSERTPFYFRNTDINTWDIKGRTAFEIIEKRSGLPNEFRLKFEQLLANVKVTQTNQNESETDNNFENAIEYQDIKEVQGSEGRF